jgi:hypothetical protein
MYPKVAVPRTPRIINIPSSFVPWQLEKYLIRVPRNEDEDEGQSAHWGNTVSSLCSVQNSKIHNGAMSSAAPVGQLRV